MCGPDDNIHFYRQIIDSLGSAVIVLDKDGVVITVNPSALHHLDVTEKELCAGKHLDKLELPTEFIAALNKVMTSCKAVLRREIILEREMDEDKEIGYSAFLLDGPDEFNGIIFIFTDMTERRKLERTAELNRQMAYVGELAAGVVHELRNPLSVISGLAQLMMRYVESSERAHTDAKKILDETSALNVFVTRFLGFAKPFEVKPDECEVKLITDRVKALCESKAAMRKVNLDVTCLEGLPMVCVDTGMAAEAISNIATNAIESVSENIGNVKIEASLEEDMLLFTVLDDGPGIHLKRNDDIFTPFFTKKEDGTGLGLPIAHRIITEHGGSITYGNRSEGGARFDILLPLEPPVKSSLD